MLGTKDVAFPKLNLASLYFYWAGAALALWAILNPLFGGTIGLDTGWTFYAPYSSETAGPVILGIIAAFIFGLSSILTGIKLYYNNSQIKSTRD